MKRERTKEEIERSQYISVSEIQRLTGLGRTTARKIFNYADSIDSEELGAYRPITTRVRLKSVYRVLGIKNGSLTVEK